VKRLGGVKIGDLGISKEVTRITESTGETPGTANYMSPEVINGEKDYTNKIDVWAFGCVLYELITLRRLFDGKVDFEIKKKVVEAQIALPDQVDPSLNEILNG
jgi:serine/threonine protein kinase